MAGAYLALGVGEAAARLPSALAALLLVLVQYRFARWAFGRDASWRAALVLLLSVEYVAIGRMALTDASLALWTTVAAYAFMRGWWGAPPRGRWYALAWIAAGLAALAKGPVGLLVPLLGVVAYLAARGGAPSGLAGGVAAPRPRALPPGRPPLVRGDVLAPRLGLRRARPRRDDRPRPPAGDRPGGTALFYVPVLLLGFFPWSAFLPEAVVAALRQARARARRSRARR